MKADVTDMTAIRFGFALHEAEFDLNRVPEKGGDEAFEYLLGKFQCGKTTK